jgi:hypothetical protein
MKKNIILTLVIAAVAGLGLAASTADAAIIDFGTMTTTGDGNVGWTYAPGGGSGSAGDGSPNAPSWYGKPLGHTGTSNGDALAAGDYTIDFLHAWTYQGNPGTINVEAFAFDGSTETSLGTATVITLSSPVKTWTAGSHNFSVTTGSALIGQDLRLRFTSPSSGYAGFDTITGDFEAVPEPGSLALLGLGGLLVARRRRG